MCSSFRELSEKASSLALTILLTLLLVFIMDFILIVALSVNIYVFSNKIFHLAAYTRILWVKICTQCRLLFFIVSGMCLNLPTPLFPVVWYPGYVLFQARERRGLQRLIPAVLQSSTFSLLSLSSTLSSIPRSLDGLKPAGEEELAIRLLKSMKWLSKVWKEKYKKT